MKTNLPLRWPFFVLCGVLTAIFVMGAGLPITRAQGDPPPSRTPVATNLLTRPPSTTPTLRMTRAANTPTSTPARPTRTPTIPSTPTTRPSRTPTLTATPPRNPLENLRLRSWKSVGTALTMQVPGLWQANDDYRGFETALFFNPEGAFLAIGLYVTDGNMSENPSVDEIMSLWVHPSEQKENQPIELSGYTGLKTLSETFFDLPVRGETKMLVDTRLALVMPGLYVVIFSTAPAEFGADLISMMDVITTSLVIDETAAQRIFGNQLPTLTPTFAPPTFTPTTDINAAVNTAVAGTIEARATLTALPPSSTPLDQALIGTLVAATETAFYVGTQIALTLGASDAQPTANMAATIQAGVAATQTARAGQPQATPTPTFTPTTARRPNSGTPVPTVSTQNLPVVGHILGDPNAVVIIKMYSDLTCYHCGRFMLEFYPQLKEEFGDAFALHLILYPVLPNGLEAALAAECADEQGMFWEYATWVYGNPIRPDSVDEDLMAGGKAIGIPDLDDFSDCYTSMRHFSKVETSYREGQRLALNAVPIFFIGEDRHEGTSPELMDFIRKHMP
jgi:protein-disulfide isomerase